MEILYVFSPEKSDDEFIISKFEEYSNRCDFCHHHQPIRVHIYFTVQKNMSKQSKMEREMWAQFSHRFQTNLFTIKTWEELKWTSFTYFFYFCFLFCFVWLRANVFCTYEGKPTKYNKETFIHFILEEI